MVAPITGPFAGPEGNINTQSAYASRLIWRQAQPHDLPLQYYADRANMSTAGGYTRNAVTTIQGVVGDAGYTATENWVVNTAYQRFRDSIHEGADVGVDLAEGRQSFGMMAGRAGQLAGFTKDLLRGNFLGAARRLNLAVVPKGVSAKKSLANNWLEYHFGWVPLIKDIYACIDVFQNPIKTLTPFGTAKSSYYKEFKAGAFPNNTTETWSCLIRARMGAQVSISNPNLWLANNLGLVNPAGIAWELVPFSFVVDWFVNVGDVLSSGTDLLGLSVTNAYTVTHAKIVYFGSLNNQFQNPTFSINKGNGIHMRRFIGLQGPTLMVRPWKIWGYERGLTAIGLVVQGLDGIGKGKRG